MPYTRGTNEEPGSGMGLSIVKRLCDRFGWRIELIASNVGSHFKVTLIGASAVKRADESVKTLNGEAKEG